MMGGVIENRYLTYIDVEELDRSEAEDYLDQFEIVDSEIADAYLTNQCELYGKHKAIEVLKIQQKAVQDNDLGWKNKKEEGTLSTNYDSLFADSIRKLKRTEQAISFCGEAFSIPNENAEYEDY